MPKAKIILHFERSCWQKQPPEMFCKKRCSQNLQENTCIRVSFLIKLQASVCNFFQKETLALLFSCELFEISKNTFFHRTPLGNCFWFEIWQITCYLKDLRTLLKTLCTTPKEHHIWSFIVPRETFSSN